MKKIVLILAITAMSCEKNTCQTCTETTTVKHRDVAANSTRYDTSISKFSLCDEDDIADVDGTVVSTPNTYTAPLVYYKITVETNCE